MKYSLTLIHFSSNVEDDFYQLVPGTLLEVDKHFNHCQHKYPNYTIKIVDSIESKCSNFIKKQCKFKEFYIEILSEGKETKYHPKLLNLVGWNTCFLSTERCKLNKIEAECYNTTWEDNVTWDGLSFTQFKNNKNFFNI